MQTTYIPNAARADGASTVFAAVPVHGTPEGSVAAPPASLAVDVDSGTIYVKLSGTGSTGWQAASGGGGGTSYFNKIGTAYIGGDQAGDARGTNALDVQTGRTDASHVASGLKSVAAGYNCTANSANSIAIGNGALTSGDAHASTVIGYRCSASSYGCTVSGYYNTASAYYATASGYGNNASGGSASAIGSANTASGFRGSAIGFNNKATGQFDSAIGYWNTASNYGATAFGNHSVASGNSSIASGSYCTASGDSSFASGSASTASGYCSSALGFRARARIDKTTNICGPQIIRKDAGDAQSGMADFESFCGVETVLMTSEVTFKSNGTLTMALPSGCHFWLDEAFVLSTAVSGLTVQPFIQFGNGANTAKYLPSTQTTLLTAAQKRERYAVTGMDGETTLTAAISTNGTATTMTGRFGFRGLLIEDQT